MLLLPPTRQSFSAVHRAEACRSSLSSRGLGQGTSATTLAFSSEPLSIYFHVVFILLVFFSGLFLLLEFKERLDLSYLPLIFWLLELFLSRFVDQGIFVSGGTRRRKGGKRKDITDFSYCCDQIWTTGNLRGDFFCHGV